ncbi:BRCA2-interacting transcriptional repressor EMSY, partial [Schistosoma japonicum]
DSNPLDVVYQLSKEIHSTAVILLRIDLSKIDKYDNDDALIDIPLLFSNDQITALLDCLRFLRRWAATIPDLLADNNNNNNLSPEIINCCRKDVFDKLNNLLDSFFLCLFEKDKIASFWCHIPIDVQSSVILCISVCLQVIINLLSESSLRDSIELFDIIRLFSILLSGCRPVICLTDYGLKLWNNGQEHLDQHQINHCRLSSHYAYLIYLLLLRVEQNVDNIKMPDCILQTLYNKCLRDRVILQSIMEQACQSMNEENDLSAKPIHFQLLSIQFATSLNKYVVSSPEKIVTSFDVGLLQSVIDITGLTLLLLCQNEISDSKQSSTTFLSQSVVAQRILPSSIKSCLSYWFSYLSMFHTSPLINDAVDELLKELSRLCSSWIRELMIYSPDDEIVHDSTVCLLSVNYPYARLRGLIHILASITLSGLDRCGNSMETSIRPNESLNCSNGDQQPVEMQLSVNQESESSSELKISITQEYANELLILLCNILVIIHHATVKLEEFYNIPNSVENDLVMRNDLVKTKGVGVYPSKLSKKMVLLSKRSPFSLVQAVCFKQDVIRCIVGLITQFPQLSLSLALHKFDPNDKYTTTNDDTLITSTTNTLSLLSAFEVILDATNRDPFNSFCVEWAILLIRLLFKSNHDQTSQVIPILSSKLNGLNIK